MAATPREAMAAMVCCGGRERTRRPDAVGKCYDLLVKDELELDQRIPATVTIRQLSPEQTGFPAWQRHEDMVETDADNDRGHADLITPEGASNSTPRIIYLHGGGYECYSPQDVYRPCTGRLAEVSEMVVLAIDYRKCPEFRYPACLDDAVQGYQWLAENGPFGPSKASALLIAGDSAGGGLALALALRLRDQGIEPRVAGVSVVSPETDLSCGGESYATRKWRAGGDPAKCDPMFRDEDPVAESMETIYHLLGKPGQEGAYDTKEPGISVLHAELHGLPPTQIHVGDAEVMLSDSTEFAARARKAGSHVECTVWPRMWHTFTQYSEAGGVCGEPLAEAVAAIRQQGFFLKNVAAEYIKAAKAARTAAPPGGTTIV